MKNFQTWLTLFAFVGAASVHAQGLMGGGVPPPPVQCISDAEWTRARHSVNDYERAAAPALLAVPEKFTFYPMGARLYRDVFTTNFNDLLPGPGIRDFDCTEYTYNGHNATDTGLRTFGEQAIGVPVFAALNGTVIATHDGEEDMHTACGGTANSVIIDHGGGRKCYYWHLRKNSVLVSPGQIVKAGEQIGLVASSGCSSGPHLHFGTFDNGQLIEPYAGPCRPGESEWVSQTPIERGLYARDLNLTNVDIAAYPGLPFDMPRSGTFVQGSEVVRFWVNLINQPADSTWRVRYQRPDATLALDSGSVAFGNAFARSAWWWWAYTVNLNAIGTWHMVLDINGSTLVDAPFDVVASAEEIVNRAPYPIGVELWPRTPRATSVVICNVLTDLVVDDPDYDIVRYHYVWKRNGNVVRDVTTAGHADVFPRDTASNGSVLSCEVTATDGTDSAPTVVDSVRIGWIPDSPQRKP
jgi:hypothetical protein